MNFKHNHRVQVGEAFSYLRLSEATKTKFVEYFNMGMSPASAHKFHELSIIGEHGACTEFSDVTLLANSQINPRLRQIYVLYDEWR